ncbi:kinase-like domain-containing protein [Rhizophagus irregularis DAOM 181602=DAOM 197198]|nr:kinase-like domain-containing protein [Rhizophagus irregularis DAOM 181602=DAOM 197198]
MTVYSAIWKDGPLYKENSLNEANKYPIEYNEFHALYGISQIPDTGDYILVLIWTSGNEKIDDEANKYPIEYNEFHALSSNKKVSLKCLHNSQGSIDSLINEAKKYPTKCNSFQVLDLNKEVTLKYLHNSQESIDSLINEAKKYLSKHKAFQVLYGISQNPDTGDYILVFEWTSSNKKVALKCLHNSQESINSLINEAKKYPKKYEASQILFGISQNPDTEDYILVFNWTSGNEKIDDFILERQLNINNFDDTVLEWIPYNQFNEIKMTGKNELTTVYLAIWKDGPIHKKNKQSNYIRDSYKEVSLKCIHNSQESIDSLIDEAKKYPIEYNEFYVLYGISQNPDTADYILKYSWSNYTRDSNKEVALKCLHNSQESIDSLINEAKKYPIKYKAFQVVYGISQNPDTGDYILVLNWTRSIDSLINKVKKYSTIYKEFQVVYGISQNPNTEDYILVFSWTILEWLEWIPYNQFNELKETESIDSLIYEARKYLAKDSNKKVSLKCLHNLQESTDSLINKAKTYSTKREAFQALYGISQNPDTRHYILVLIWANSIDYLINEAKKYSAKYKAFQVFQYTRDSNKEVALKCIQYSHESIDSLINEAKKYLTKHKAFQILNAIKNKSS